MNDEEIMDATLPTLIKSFERYNKEKWILECMQKARADEREKCIKKIDDLIKFKSDYLKRNNPHSKLTHDRIVYFGQQIKEALAQSDTEDVK